MIKNIAVATVAALSAGFLSPAWAADNVTQYQDEARGVVKSFGQTLGGELKKALQEEGPAAAIGVCKDRAPAIGSQLSRDNGWRVSRVSLRARNPMLGFPDAWEQKVLADFDARQARGEAVETMEHAEIVSEPQGKFFRYLKPVATQQLCLTCHGARENIPEPVRDALAKTYPHDTAVGYSLGQVRGAVSIKRPL
jgi:hypothetical protein